MTEDNVMTTDIRSSTIATTPFGITAEEKKIIIASSFGAFLEWYDFYIYAALAVYFSGLFFPPGNESAAFLGSLATFGAGFLVRPIGALFFGRLGDIIGRKHTFLMTIVLMGLSTIGIGLLPTYESIGIAAPTLLVALRLLQGLALGGEVGGAVTYVAEQSPTHRRGLYTSSLQTTATFGLLISLLVVYVLKALVTEAEFRAWGWRIPFIVSFVMLVISVYIRTKLHESPTFQRMKAQGATSKSPILESFTRWNNLKFVLLLFFIASGLGGIFGTGHFYSMFFLTQTLKLPQTQVHLMMGIALVALVPFYLFFGWLSDKIGRKWIMLTACLLAAITIQPIFKALTHYANPALESFQENNHIDITANDCRFNLFSKPDTACDKVRSFLNASGVSYSLNPSSVAGEVKIHIGRQELEGFNPEQLKTALKMAGWPETADVTRINRPIVTGLLFILVVYLAMIYGPLAAFMVELFPARIRYTSLSLPFHLGSGWVGGMLPFVVSAMNVSAGDIYYGLWYPVIVSGVALLVGLFFMPETRGRAIDH
jgi:MFS family permease